MKCPNCGYEASATAKVCSQCGTRLVQPVSGTEKPEIEKKAEKAAPVRKTQHGGRKWLLPLVLVLLAGLVLVALLLLGVFKDKQPAPGSEEPEPSVLENNSNFPQEVEKPFISQFVQAQGEWVGIDTDGSQMSLIIIHTGNNSFEVILRDEGASGCGYDSSGQSLLPFNAKGSGVAQDYIIEITDMIGKCEQTGQEIEFELSLIYNPSTDTLKDKSDVIWTRK